MCLGGKTLFDSEQGINEPLRNRRIGMIFQDDRLFPHLSVAANIGFGLKGCERGPARDRLAEVAALCGVENLLDRMPARCSPAESASASAWPGRSRPVRDSCSAMSRSRPSIWQIDTLCWNSYERFSRLWPFRCST